MCHFIRFTIKHINSMGHSIDVDASLIIGLNPLIVTLIINIDHLIINDRIARILRFMLLQPHIYFQSFRHLYWSRIVRAILLLAPSMKFSKIFFGSS